MGANTSCTQTHTHPACTQDLLFALQNFRAMALGWEEVDETELVKGQMVNVVLACIRRITTTKGDNLKDALATGGQVKVYNRNIHPCVHIFS